jgi:hypothetical protein
MRTTTSKTLLLILLLTPAALSAPAQKHVPDRNARLIRNIRGRVEAQGCGCHFQFLNEDRNSNHYLFFEDFSEESPLMNINGGNVRLKLVGSSEPSGGVKKKGERFSRSYMSGNVKVRIDFVTTSVCAANDESCESTGYDVTVMVMKGGREQTVKAVGGCGC